MKERSLMSNNLDSQLYQEVAKFGAKDMEICMQCGVCSASCPLSSGNDTFPRKIYRYLQLGLRDKLLSSAVPWLCYYCGECNLDCPRGAEPAETMMATRRWLTTEYDWTGLAKRLYLSEKWEFGALAVVALFVVLLFVFGHGPIITEYVSVNSFAPVMWIEIGDLTMAFILTVFLMSNAFRMYRFIMDDTKVPFWIYVTEAKSFVLHFATQKRWRECSEDKSRWLKHFLLVTGYLTMMTLVIVFIRWFQVDDSSWHFTSIFGYYATGVLLFITVEMFRSRLKKEEAIHRFSELSDWLFLILLFLTTLTGILMHIIRIAGWPMGTYVMYVIHLAVAVPMLVIEVPFGKWSHLFYRPLAVFLSTVKEKAAEESRVTVEEVREKAGELFMTCMQCGTCTSVCPWNQLSSFNPRRILRQISLGNGTERSVDEAVWSCVTCNSCGTQCPRGIELVDVIRAVREHNIERESIPEYLDTPLYSLIQNGNPWNGDREKRLQWAKAITIPPFSAEHEYCLFTCCTSAYDSVISQNGGQQTGISLVRLITQAGISFGTLGTQESCCGDPAHKTGSRDISANLIRRNTDLFLQSGVEKLLTTSPHCLNMFRNAYTELKGSLTAEHYTELLDHLIETGRLEPVKEIDRIITYHDPCYLGRYNGIYEAPRRILQSIPGLKLIEMPNSKERSVCCGGGGGGAWQDLPVEERLGVLRIREAMFTGAEVIVTTCPFCIRMLNQAIAELGVEGRIVVRELAELLWEAVDVKGELSRKAHVNHVIDQEVVHV
jgi:Fe-S oxidoreductase